MKTAKIFTHGHSQAVRLPKEFRFDVTEVYIEKSGEGVILTPKKPDAWRSAHAVAGKFKGALDRAQPEAFDHRDWPAHARQLVSRRSGRAALDVEDPEEKPIPRRFRWVICNVPPATSRPLSVAARARSSINYKSSVEHCRASLRAVRAKSAGPTHLVVAAVVPSTCLVLPSKVIVGIAGREVPDQRLVSLQIQCIDFSAVRLGNLGGALVGDTGGSDGVGFARRCAQHKSLTGFEARLSDARWVTGLQPVCTRAATDHTRYVGGRVYGLYGRQL